MDQNLWVHLTFHQTAANMESLHTGNCSLFIPLYRFFWLIISEVSYYLLKCLCSKNVTGLPKVYGAQNSILKSASRRHRASESVCALIKTAWANQRQPAHTSDKTVSSSLRFIAAASGSGLMRGEREHEFMYHFMSGSQMRLTINR